MNAPFRNGTMKCSRVLAYPQRYPPQSSQTPHRFVGLMNTIGRRVLALAFFDSCVWPWLAVDYTSKLKL